MRIKDGLANTVRGIAAVTGEDADRVLDDLVREAVLRVARHLGVTVPELRAGGSGQHLAAPDVLC